MFTGPQVAELLVGFVMMIAAVWGVVWKLQMSLKADFREAQEGLSRAIKEVKDAQDENVTETREQLSEVNKGLNHMGLQINTILEGNVRELQGRVTRLESGQDEWTKTLRQRTHDLANEMQALRLTVELMKAGKQA